MLGIDWNGPNSRLARFDPATMRIVSSRTASLGAHIGQWSLSPDGSQLAIATQDGWNVRFVDVGKLRSIGDLDLAAAGTVRALAWTHAQSLLGVLSQPQGATVVVVDPQLREVIRRTPIGGSIFALDRLTDGLVLLLGPDEGFATARLAVVSGDGTVRGIALDGITIGSRFDPQTATRTQRRAGLAVDPQSRTAYVVDADRIASVALDSLDVTYLGQPRQLAKSVEGPARNARWLGDGLVAVAGPDYGLHVLDVRDWTIRTVDPAASYFSVAPGVLVTRTEQGATAYGFDGRVRFSVALAKGAWLNVLGSRYASACIRRKPFAVVDLATGLVTTARAGSRCGDVLSGRSSGW